MTKKFIVLMCLTLDVTYNNNKRRRSPLGVRCERIKT